MRLAFTALLLAAIVSSPPAAVGGPSANPLVDPEVRARLPHPHASLVRRYSSVPQLALEIDARALQALEAMSNIVAAVRLDRAVKPE